MRYFKLLIPLFAMLLMYAECRKQRLGPDDTYFHCKLNGDAYVPNNCANCLQCNFLGDTSFAIRANNGFETLGLGILIYPSIQTGTYPLNEVIQHGGDYGNSVGTADHYYTDATHTGQLTITRIDKIRKLIAGSFYFRAYNALRNDSITASAEFQLEYSY